MDSNKWKNDIQEIKKNNREILSLKNGVWQVEDKIRVLLNLNLFFFDSHLYSIKRSALKIFSEIHPQFEIDPKDRFAFATFGKTSKYSDELRKGIAETLAFLGVHGNKLKNCTLHKPEETSNLAISKLLRNADWKLWASLNELLPILAEASPKEFLTSIENCLKQDPCLFDELFKQEGKGRLGGANYMTGLYRALEVLAWSEDYLPKAIMVLAELAERDPGGRYANRPANSIIMILFPLKPQTTGSIDLRIASIKGIRKSFPNTAWNIVLNLLPNQQQTLTKNKKPSFRSFIPNNWEEKLLTKDYWKQVKIFAKIAVNMAKENIQYVKDLVKNLDNIPQPSYDEFIAYLSSEEVLKLSDEEKQPIWETMTEFIRKHRYFSDKEWALSKEMVDLLEETANKVAPLNPLYLYRYLFSNSARDLLGKDVGWQSGEKELLKQRIEAIKQIYGINKTQSIINFAKLAENSTLVGDVFARIAHEKDDKEFLPKFLDSEEEYKKQFISGYIKSRYQSLSFDWVESLLSKDWTIKQKQSLFLNLPFELEIWKKAEEILDKEVVEYWRNIKSSPFGTQSDLKFAIQKLLKYDRPYFALDCIYAHYYLGKGFLKTEAVAALLKGASGDDKVETAETYHVVEIIKMLQNDPQIDKDELFKIEWAYLALLDRYSGAKPKTIEKRLSENPDLFMEVIELVYRSEKQPEKKKIVNKESVLNARLLLDLWKRPPGKQDDGTFCEEELNKWFAGVKDKSKESGHYKVAMTRIGHVLFYSIDLDPKGLWIHRAAAELLDEKDNDYIRQGFTTEAYNSRGLHQVDPSGKQERDLAEFWRERARSIENLGLIHFSSSLKNLADSYDREADRIIFDYGDDFGNEDTDE